jgi:hypothetical protein
LDFKKTMGLVAAVLATFAVRAAPATPPAPELTCQDFKSTFQRKVQTKIYDTCRELAGRNISPEKRELVKKVSENLWSSEHTFECMTRCGDSSSCVRNHINAFTEDALNEIVPKLTAEWCVASN